MTVAPVLPSTGHGALRPIGIEAAVVTGGHWARMQSRNADRTLPTCLAWLHRTGAIDNFHRSTLGTRRSTPFSDSDVYKVLEALIWEEYRSGADLGEPIGQLSSAVAAAAEPDGYINTFYGRPWNLEPRYSDLANGHELYSLGHLIQAGVASLRTGSHPVVAELAIDAAHHVVSRFGPGRELGICGHPEIEMALIELYRSTGDDSFLMTARELIVRRGHGLLGPGRWGSRYFQDDVPQAESTVFGGHAVRALYLACGAVDVAVETGDASWLTAVERQWENLVERRSHLTGGVGSRHRDESIGEDFELPADRAYSETCASIACAMLSWRLLLATGKARYADRIERLLHNAIPVAISDRGDRFFYANTLHQRIADHSPDLDIPSPSEAAGRRASWFEVCCCPTNLSRFLASVPAYMATWSDAGLQLHQYAEGTFACADLGVRVHGDYPQAGRIGIDILHSRRPSGVLSLRIPEWAGGARVTTASRVYLGEPGRYLALDEPWTPGDGITLDLGIRPRLTFPDPRVDATRGCAAVEAGPVVYCLESTGELDLSDVSLDPTVLPASVPPSGLEHPTGIRVAVGSLTEPSGEPAGATLIPYARWSNRGPSTMRVWLPLRSPVAEFPPIPSGSSPAPEEKIYP